MLKSFAVDFSWQTGDLNVFLPVILSIVFFSIYWFTAKSQFIKLWFSEKYDSDTAAVKTIAFSRIVGFLSMGVMPVTLCLIFLPGYSISDYGLAYKPETIVYSIVWIIGLSLVVIPVAYFSAKKTENLVNYPQIRARIWTRRTVIINVVTWALYLLGYEFLFRGVLLIPLSDQIGIWPAIAINIALYSATHIPKGLAETVGAAPLGLILCLLTLTSGTIWIAYFVHLAMALANSFTALKFNPDMQYTHSRK